MRIALDAMGTDRFPAVEVQGAIQALREIPGEFELVLVGDEAVVSAELESVGDYPRDRLSILHAPQRIEPGEAPASAVRRKGNSSIVVGLKAHREGSVDAFVSAGSTGAVMAASLFLLRALPGVDRPAIATILPTAADSVVMVDAGANVDCRPVHLHQFAHLGAIYAREVLRRPMPRVGLLNIGEEPEKGNELAVETHELLTSDRRLNFVGNIEGRDIITGACDVLVTDGFAGNVLLKFYESIAGFLRGILKRELRDVDASPDLRKVFEALDYTEYGGAPLLGVNGIPIICHGGSPPRAIKNAIGAAIRAVETGMVELTRAELTAAMERMGGDAATRAGRLAEGA